MDDAETPELAITVSRITAPKASDVLAEALRARIRSGQWPEGVALPSERDLALQARLSRTTVREALRILELDGLIEIRPGRGGGARVRRPAGDELSRQLELFIWGRNIGARHLHDVRSALEALGAASAARMRTESDLADLVAKTEAVERSVDNLSSYLDANLAWHMAVVHASHNELLVSFMEVLAQAIHEATELDAFDSVELRTQTLKIHRAILDAIVAGDADAARRRMARHVLAARDVALAPSPPQAAQVTPARAGKSPARRPAASTPKGRARSRAKPSARKGAK